MERDRMPKPGQLYNHFKNKPYQVITVATHADTREEVVVYQALYGDYKCYIRPLDSFLSEVDHVKYPEVQQKYRFELWTPLGQKEMKQEQVETIPNVSTAQKEISYDNIEYGALAKSESVPTEKVEPKSESVPAEKDEPKSESVNEVLLKFLDAESFYKKLEVITSNRKHMNDRLINDMAVSLDCAVDEGPLDQRIQGLITCLQAMCRFEDKRLR
ncbi:MAG: hypothetical protein H6Q59_2332 [Firmicutes bacterium]|nr:hypothetical protein [Bacillota bacterium]